MSQFPPAFYEDMTNWAASTGVPAVVTRYFINLEGEKVLLQHDEDFCASPGGGSQVPADCDQMNADAAEIDLQAAYFLASAGNASNASAKMAMENEQTVWIHLRDTTCMNTPDSEACRIHMTRERTHVLLKHRPVPRPVGAPKHK